MKKKTKKTKVGKYEYVNVRVMKRMMINGVLVEPLDIVLVEDKRAKRMIKAGDAANTTEADVDIKKLNKKLKINL